MSRLIDADKIDFNEVFVGQSDFAKDTRDAARSLIDAQPTVEAVPVIHGEWIGGKWYKECSVCSEVFTPTTTLPNFCPNCGADMRKKV